MFSQMGKRGGVMEERHSHGIQGGEDTVWHREVAVMVVERAVPHSHVVDKNRESYHESE